jgi:hypothetical protein
MHGTKITKKNYQRIEKGCIEVSPFVVCANSILAVGTHVVATVCRLLRLFHATLMTFRWYRQCTVGLS